MFFGSCVFIGVTLIEEVLQDQPSGPILLKVAEGFAIAVMFENGNAAAPSISVTMGVSVLSSIT